MSKQKSLSGAQVLARMVRGDLPTIKGGYSEKSVFEDGAVASNKVMHRLRKLGLANPPQHSSVHSPWTLPERTRREHQENLEAFQLLKQALDALSDFPDERGEYVHLTDAIRNLLSGGIDS